MQATTARQRSGKLWLLVLVGLALAIVFPLTAHALNGHTGQYNATSIQDKINNDGCLDRSFHVCSDGTAYILCEIKIDIMGALVIGLKRLLPNTITGYAARPTYWQNAVAKRNCISLVPVLFVVACFVMCGWFTIKRMFRRNA